jgi:hypothetical protein
MYTMTSLKCFTIVRKKKEKKASYRLFYHDLCLQFISIQKSLARSFDKMFFI